MNSLSCNLGLIMGYFNLRTSYLNLTRLNLGLSICCANYTCKFNSTHYNRLSTIHETPKTTSPVQMAYTSFKSTSPKTLSSAPPLVIMHGLLGSKTNWMSLGKAINQQTGRIVYTVDARNHGESPHTDNFNYYNLADDITYFLKEHTIPKACLIGHSMGGRAVMTVALQNPDVVDKLIVLDMSPVGASGKMSTLPRLVEIMRRVVIPADLEIHKAREFVDNQLLPLIPDSEIRLFILTNLIKRERQFCWKVNLDAIAKHFNPHISTYPPAKDGRSFDGETHFIGGALSDYIKPSDHNEIRIFFPNAKFSYLEGAGHWLHSDKPKEFLQLIIPLIEG